MDRENIHACWSLVPRFDTETGEKTTSGLFALGGHGGDGAVRELKKRCENELKLAEKPLVGCAMYVNLIMGWVKSVLDHKERLKRTEVMLNFAADKSFRENFERSFRLVGEDEIVDIIEETWAKYQKEKEIPDSVRMDVEDDIAAILEDAYCPVGLKPENFSPAEIQQSKELALELGKRKRPKKPAETVPEEGKSPEKSPEKPDIRAEIEETIKKAR